MPVNNVAVRAALAAGAAPIIVNAGPNLSTGVSLANEIPWSTTTAILQPQPQPQPTPVADNFFNRMADTPTTFVTVTATATATAVKKRDVDENLEIIEDGGNDAVDSGDSEVEIVETLHPDDVAAGFDPSDPDIEIAESLHNPGDEKKAPYIIGGGEGEKGPPIATKVAGAFGPGHVPAHPDDFNVKKGPVPPNFRHKQKDKSDKKKARKGKKNKDAYQKLQEERKAFLAKLEAEAQAAAAAAVGA